MISFNIFITLIYSENVFHESFCILGTEHFFYVCCLVMTDQINHMVLILLPDWLISNYRIHRIQYIKHRIQYIKLIYTNLCLIWLLLRHYFSVTKSALEESSLLYHLSID